MRRWLFLAALLALLASPAQADLIGATVNVSAYFPNTASLFADPGDVIVSNAVEYPSGSFDPYAPDIQLDITGNQFILDDSTGRALPAASAIFNGYILRVLSGPEIVSASVDPNTGWSPVEVTVVNGDLLINYQGVSGGTGPLSIINFTTAPEAGASLLAAVSLLGLAVRLSYARAVHRTPRPRSVVRWE